MTVDAHGCSVAIPCRTDEPALGATLEALWRDWRAAAGAPVSGAPPLEIAVCLNGRDPATGPAAVDAARFAAAHRDEPLRLRVLPLAQAGKARAWNALRRDASRAVVLFADADVEIASGTIGRLLSALAERSDAVLVTPRTRCAPRLGWFESVMAAPYAVPFPNLSGQLYAARTDRLPAAMPECLIEPERWLELAVGAPHVLQVPEASVVVRLPGTLRDFVRQRVRIEMGKVQLRRDFSGLLPRGAVQPGARAALRALPVGTLARLAVYLALREACHLVAWWRYRSVEDPTAWPQAPSTKDWGGR